MYSYIYINLCLCKVFLETKQSKEIEETTYDQDVNPSDLRQDTPVGLTSRRDRTLESRGLYMGNHPHSWPQDSG